MLKISLIILLSLTVSIVSSILSFTTYAAAPYAQNVVVHQNADNLPPTPGDSLPTSGGGWTYFENDGYGHAGFQKNSSYINTSNEFDKIFLYDASSRRVWENYHYLQISSAPSITGNAIEQVITGGVRDETTSDSCGVPLKDKKTYLNLIANGIDPVCKDKSYYLGEGYIYVNNINGTPFETAQKANRLSVYIKVPEYFSIGNDTFPKRNLNIGPYSYTGGGHYYHYYYVEGNGGWIHLLVDTHPTHNNTFKMVNHPGYTEEYFKQMYMFYVRAWNESPESLGWQGSGIAPYSIFYDDMEFYYDAEPQNDQTINSPGIGYNSTTKNFNISFNDKYWDFDSPATYEIKYSFTPITNSNYSAADFVQIRSDGRFGIQDNDLGRVSKSSTYRNMLWAPFTLKTEHQNLVQNGDRIYFAIKDISNRDYNDSSYDKINDVATVTVEGLGELRKIDLIKRIDYLFIDAISQRPLIRSIKTVTSP